jgi:hypothetical protein
MISDMFILKCSLSAGSLNLIWPSSTGLGALYGPSIPHMLPASVHRTIVNAFKGIINLNPPLSEAVVGIWNPSVFEWLIGSYSSYCK